LLCFVAVLFVRRAQCECEQRRAETAKGKGWTKE